MGPVLNDDGAAKRRPVRRAFQSAYFRRAALKMRLLPTQQSNVLWKSHIQFYTGAMTRMRELSLTNSTASYGDLLCMAIDAFQSSIPPI